MLKIGKSHNAYDTLGLPRSATTTQVRARYRHLVRGHKRELAPSDVVKDQQFKEWANAYLLLTGPFRKDYDRRLRLSRGREQPDDLLSGMPEGRRLLFEAETALLQRKLNDAVELGKSAVKLESRNGEAYALLGDILREQSKYGNALTMYNYAIQFAPNNRRYWQLLEEVTALRDGKALPKHHRSELMSPLRRPLWVWLLIAAALGLVEVTILSLRLSWGTIGFLNLPTGFTYGALGSGFLLGLVLAATAVIGPFDDEMIWYQVAGFGTGTTPIGALIALPGIVFFWTAPIFYIIVSFLDEHFSASVGICLAICGAVALAFSVFVPQESTRWVQMIGGNIVFFGFMMGWLIGSIRKRSFEH